MATSRTETVTAADGGSFEALLVLPEDLPAPGVLLFQEVFGVNDFITSKAEHLAAEGYAVLCPDVFWRVAPGYAVGHTDEALQEAIGVASRYSTEVDHATKVGDLLAALAHLRSLPETSGKAAVMGYCLGGWLAYETAAAGEPDSCVSYYGSQIVDRLDDADRITCPTLFHFGGSDPFLPRDKVAAIEAAFAGRGDVEIRVEEAAGHAFENHLAQQFHDPDAAARSWPATLEFLQHALR
jgi:carboxymethylenebutenolidase